MPSVFTKEIGGTPTLTFEAQNLREANELCHEKWLKDDLAEAKSDGAPLWDGKAKLRARIALPDERALFAEAERSTSNLSIRGPFRRPDPDLPIWQFPTGLKESKGPCIPRLSEMCSPCSK
jgi:hypothetical protein